MVRLISFLVAILLLAWPASGQAPGLAMLDLDHVTICPATEAQTSPPDFTAATCTSARAEEIDPQGSYIWVRTTVNLDSVRGARGEPLSVYVSGKMASQVYLNGVYVGANGAPAADAAGETPGKMDTELYPPQSLFRIGENEVVFRASAHHGVIDLYRPFHLVGIAPAGAYSNTMSPRLIMALVTLSLFCLGGLYFGVMALIGTSRVRSLTLSAMSFFAAAQLVSEALRNLVAYAYPIHDVRLIAIAVFSSAFGISVAFHTFRTFMTGGFLKWVGGLAALSFLSLTLIPGFDFKALTAMTIPLLGTLIATGIWTYQGRTRAFLYFLALLIFLLAIVVFQGLFLDTVFFLLVALLLLLLFIEQAVILADEERERRNEEARANRLEQALAEAGERAASSHINVKGAGSIERIETGKIVHCRGAGGYTEIVLMGGRTVLHSMSLNELEEVLPATFLRVHRSHLINVMHVAALKRESSGTGTLSLADDVTVPVSRRIMPKVREALN